MSKRFLVELTDRETPHRIVERLHHRSGPLDATVRQIMPVIAKLMKLAGLEVWAIPSPSTRRREVAPPRPPSRCG
jgi:hypothetical protein